MILLITPPFTSLNTPYPATTVLTAYLRSKGYTANQMDLGIEVLDKILNSNFIGQVFDKAFELPRLSKKLQQILPQKDQYILTIDAVMRFLRGFDSTLANKIVSGNFLPEASRFKAAADQDQLDWAFGIAGTVDRAKHLATLYLEDLTDLIAEVIDPNFSFSKYGDQLALAAASFDSLQSELENDLNEIEVKMVELLDSNIAKYDPQWIGFSVPFPGALLSALRCGQHIKQKYGNKIKIILGGGYINTELRQLSESRIFDYCDYITFDDGEIPIERLIEGTKNLVRTIFRDPISGCVTTLDDKKECQENLKFESLPSPCFDGLALDKYFSTITLTNPMHKLWSDGLWNKMTVAHGCYWAKCTFCDISLDYIGRYDAPCAQTVVDRMEDIMAQTGSSGFHFTDEALPPKLLKEIAREIIKRKLVVSFWGNIRFEKNYDLQTCKLLAQAGCIAVSGGMEVACPRILELINKGISLDSLENTLSAFAENGIMVHAYLMYGFPSQTLHETIESLETVRHFFEQGLVQSAFWHQYAMTIHSPTGMDPQKFGVERLQTKYNSFANNGTDFVDPVSTEVNWTEVGRILSLATYNFMHYNCMEKPASSWFKSMTKNNIKVQTQNKKSRQNKN